MRMIFNFVYSQHNFLYYFYISIEKPNAFKVTPGDFFNTGEEIPLAFEKLSN